VPITQARIELTRESWAGSGAMGLSWIGILGPVELAGEGPVPLSGVKERCLLAALAVHCGKTLQN
jgi:hypothetical protein